MAAASSSTSSASGDQYADQMRHMQQVMNGLRFKYPSLNRIDRISRISRNIHKEGEGLRLKVPDDMLVLVNKYVGWDTPRDINSARGIYTSIQDGLKDPNFNIEKELEKLKGLSSTLGRKCDVFEEECGQLSLKHGDCCESLVEKLVEQEPRIKGMPRYEDVTTRREKLWIERALRKKGQMVELGEHCKRHLEDFRKEVKPMAEKVAEAYAQLGNARMLLHTVNEFIHILATTKQRGFNVGKDNFRRYEKKRKRNTLGDNVSREVMKEIDVSQEVDRKAVEVSLLELLKKASGKALESKAADTEFMKKWHLIVNDFIESSVYLKS